MSSDLLVYDDSEFSWKARKKFPSGMTGMFIVTEVESTFEAMMFNVEAKIVKKRKREPEFLAVTGRDGLEPAMWFLKMLEKFENNVLDMYEGEYSARMEVVADDKRRWDIYKKVLTRRGYTVTMIEGQRTLVKKIGGK